MVYRLDRDNKILEQARRAFASHQISRQSEGRWLLQQRYADDKGWDWTMAAEVISLARGELYVGGDIHYVIFAWYSDSSAHERKLRWMGRCKDFSYYVKQKAVIGSGRKLVEIYESDLAIADIEALIEEYSGDEHEGAYDEPCQKLREVLNDPFAPFDDHRCLMDHLCEEVGYDFLEGHWDIGMAIDGRVHYAYAALGRLCDLLDEQSRAEQPVNDAVDQPVAP